MGCGENEEGSTTFALCFLLSSCSLLSAGFNLSFPTLPYLFVSPLFVGPAAIKREDTSRTGIKEDEERKETPLSLSLSFSYSLLAVVAARCWFVNAKFMLSHPPSFCDWELWRRSSGVVLLALFPNSLANNSQNAETGIPMRRKERTRLQNNIWRDGEREDKGNSFVTANAILPRSRFRNQTFESICQSWNGFRADFFFFFF